MQKWSGGLTDKNYSLVIKHVMLFAFRFLIQRAVQDSDLSKPFCIVIILHIERVGGGSNFLGMCGQPWACVHIDELQRGSPGRPIIDIGKLCRGDIKEALQNGSVPVKSLIQECVPRAASMVSVEPERLMERIEILLHCFSDYENYFFGVVTTIILTHMEQSLMLKDVNSWLSKLALTSKHLKEGNTFQRSIWLDLVEKVTPKMTELIQIGDTDRGLDFLKLRFDC